jgi:hypothetical protein
MRTKILFIVVYMCSALLFMQWSGMHMHASMDGHDSALHESHLHGFGADDHEADVDINLFEISTGWFKQIQFFLSLAILLIALVSFTIVIRPPPCISSPHYQQSYLRPILRAPPISH